MRNELLSWGRALFASFLMVVSTVPVVGQEASGAKDFVALIGDKAYVISEARAVSSGGIVTEFSWSETGNSALFTRLEMKISAEMLKPTNPQAVPPSLMASLMHWNRKSNAATLIYRYDTKKEAILDYGVLSDDRTTYVLTTTADYLSDTLTIVTPGGRPEVLRAAENEFLGLAHTPKSSTLLVVHGANDDGTTMRLSLYDSASKRWAPINFSVKKEQAIFPMGGPDANSYYLVIVTKDSKDRAYFRYDVRRGQVTVTTRDEMAASFNTKNEHGLPITVVDSSATLPDGKLLKSLLLCAPEGATKSSRPDKPLYFGVGATSSQLAPMGDGVLYSLDGMLIFREIISAERELFDRQEALMTKERAISNAKQVGLALIMYASDNDDFMPISDITEAVMPYCKNEEILNGFIYTYQGGNLSDLKDPANTPLGFIKGPGGTATVYADGSVRWKEDA